jgi:dTDP-4-dehydrorhamnose 3,5-epimerase
MIFTETNLPGAFIIDLEKKSDARGFFARTFCAQEFVAHGLKPAIAQSNLAFNHQRGTVRGMHYQTAPVTETKLIRCTQGAIYDVIIDMRPESPTFLSHIGIELTADNRRALYVPEMFAHGYQTLTDDTEIIYLVSEFYTPGYEQGLRYDDPFFNIDWPLDVTEISDKDLNWPLLRMMSVGSKTI